eukprot:748364-Hanusia_phi.AAC.1
MECTELFMHTQELHRKEHSRLPSPLSTDEGRFALRRRVQRLQTVAVQLFTSYCRRARPGPPGVPARCSGYHELSRH